MRVMQVCDGAMLPPPGDGTGEAGGDGDGNAAANPDGPPPTAVRAAIAAVAGLVVAGALVGAFVLVRRRRSSLRSDMERASSSSAVVSSSGMLPSSDAGGSEKVAASSDAPSIPITTTASEDAARHPIKRIVHNSLVSLGLISLFGGETSMGSGSTVSTVSTVLFTADDLQPRDPAALHAVAAVAAQLTIWRQMLLVLVRATAQRAAAAAEEEAGADPVHGLGDRHLRLPRARPRRAALLAGTQSSRDLFSVDFDAELKGQLGRMLGVGASAVVYKVSW